MVKLHMIDIQMTYKYVQVTAGFNNWHTLCTDVHLVLLAHI